MKKQVIINGVCPSRYRFILNKLRFDLKKTHKASIMRVTRSVLKVEDAGSQFAREAGPSREKTIRVDASQVA